VQQQAVRQLVPPALGDPADVRGVEGGQGLLPRDRAPPLVGVGPGGLLLLLLLLARRPLAPRFRLVAA